jgi:D-psicose/D-tagatose/L-ribulose 3-epimerase
MERGVHVHKMFGEGDLDLPPVLDALEAIGWDRLVCVELSRDAHRAHEVVPAAIRALRR